MGVAVIARAALGVALGLATACSVDALDLTGKRCPCLDGWICEPTTDTCVRDPAAADAAVDAPPDDGRVPDDGTLAIDARVIDGPPGSSCLGGDGGGELFADDFGDLIGWNTRGGSWAAVASEAVQSDSGGALTYAFPAGTATFTDYRLATHARPTGGTGALGLALRIQASGDGRYHCAWTPASGALRLQWIRTNGTLGGTLAETQVAIGSIPGYDPAAVRVVEASVVGGQLTCCVQELAGASITINDTRYAVGAPGLHTGALAAAFADVAVQAP